MNLDPNRERSVTEEYLKQAEARARRRARKRKKRIVLIGAIALGIFLVVLIISLLINASKTDSKKAKSSSSSSSSSVYVPPPPPPRPSAQDPNAWNMKLVNGQNKVTQNMLQNEDLTEMTGLGNYVDTRVAEPLRRMIADCNAAGLSLTIDTGFRGIKTHSQKYQALVDVYKKQGLGAEAANAEAKKYMDPPGETDMHTGLGIGFRTGVVSSMNPSFADTPEYAWLNENAGKYGFILRYPPTKTEITGTAFRPWYWRYVGEKEAGEMNGADMCLEEYLSPDTAPAPESSAPAPESSAPAPESSASASASK